jgi:tetrahydromethanopterin S-methyltransferase subunit H
LFSFTKKQKTFTISNIKIGGQPGQYPTVLFGGLFFKGTPNFTQAHKEIQHMLSLSKKTGNPGIPDFFIRKEEYIEDIIEFIEHTLPDNYPFSVDITDPSIKISMIQRLHDKKLLSRTIYNSLHVGITDDERETLHHYPPQMAILVAFNPKDKSPDGKLEVLENGAHLTNIGLLELAETLGITQPLIDTAALAPGDNSGASIAAIPVIKEEYGLPTGCAIHNVVEKSQWLNSFPKAKQTIDASSNVNISLFGGDFAIFGPIHHAPLLFPLMAWQDILISEYVESYFGISPDKNHPRRILFS